MPLKIYYFGVPARAMPIKAALRHGNVAFENIVVDKAMWESIRTEKGFSDLVPLGQLPVMVLESGEIIAQSLAQLRYAGKLSGLYPTDPVQCLVVDSVIESVAEFGAGVPNAPNDEEKKKLREAWYKDKAPKYFGYVSNVLARRGGPFLMGKDVTVADLVMFRTFNQFASGGFDHIPKDGINAYPNLLAHLEMMRQHPIVLNELKTYSKA